MNHAWAAIKKEEERECVRSQENEAGKERGRRGLGRVTVARTYRSPWQNDGARLWEKRRERERESETSVAICHALSGPFKQLSKILNLSLVFKISFWP